jgi:hypothetical protein
MRRNREVKPFLDTRVLSLMTFACIAVLILFPLPASAIKVTGTKYIGSIAPGSSAVHTMIVSTNPDDSPMDLTVDVLGFGQLPQQGNTGLSAEKDTSPYSARTFITVSPQTFHLDPGKSQEVKATIAVPRDVGDGGRYAMITIRNAPLGNGTTLIVTSISVPVLVTIPGSAISHTGTITDVTVSDVVPGQPIKIITSLKNTGNHHYKVIDNVSVTDSSGAVVTTAGTDVSINSIMPTFTQNYIVNLDTPLPPGTYTASSKVSSDDGTILDTKTASFVVQANYIAPLQGASTKVTAKSGGVLASPDGRVTINFPAGAVFADTDVTLKPLAKDQAPPASASMAPASTFFKVDGINGLLAKDATIIVKYTSADLDTAKSDVSKLVLARYDDPDSTWTILPTTLDKSALTLSTSTNRLSSWGVMVSSGGNTQGSSGSTAGGGTKPGLGLDTMIVFLAISLTIVFVGVHWSRKH